MPGSAGRSSATPAGGLRRYGPFLCCYALEVLGGDVESLAFVLITDVNQEDLSAADTQGTEVLDDDTLPVETRDLEAT